MNAGVGRVVWRVHAFMVRNSDKLTRIENESTK